MNKLLFGLVLLAIVSSCNKEDAPDMFKTTGAITTETREVNGFTQLDIDDNVNVIIHQDSSNQHVEVVAGKNLLPKITTTLEGNILKIRNNNKWNFMRSYKYEIDVHVYTPQLTKIEYAGGGDIKSANRLQFPSLTLLTEGGGSDVLLDLQCDSLFAILHTGVSNLYLTGNSNFTYLYSAGMNICHTENLISNDVHVNNASSGDFYVNATNSLLVEIESFSTTWYRGNPALTVFKIGTGDVKPLQ